MAQHGCYQAQLLNMTGQVLPCFLGLFSHGCDVRVYIYVYMLLCVGAWLINGGALGGLL